MSDQLLEENNYETRGWCKTCLEHRDCIASYSETFATCKECLNTIEVPYICGECGANPDSKAGDCCDSCIDDLFAGYGKVEEETEQSLMAKILRLLPDAIIDQDQDGEIIIATGFKYDDEGNLVKVKKDGDE